MIRTISKVGLAAGAAAIICGFAANSPVKADDTYNTTTVITHRHHNMNGDNVIHRHVIMPGDRDIHVIVDRKTIEFNGPGPIMVDNRVMVPVRGVFENMDGYVNWNADEQSVHGSRPGGHTFKITIDSNTAMVNGEQRTLDTPPILRDGTTYVPLRFASEALGAHVNWHPDDNSVSITTRDVDTEH